MQFKDSETQKLLRDTARSYLADKFPWERLYAIENAQEQIDARQLKEFADLGWLGLPAPESAGGSGASLMEAAVVSEEFGYAAVPVPVTLSTAVAYLLLQSDTPGTSDHLKDLASGSRVYTISESERSRGELIQWWQDPLEPLAVASGKLNGVLPLVPFGDIADYVLAPLSVDGKPAFGVIPIANARREQTALIDRANYYNVHFDNIPAGDTLVLAQGQAAETLHERCDAVVTALTTIEMVGMMRRVTEMTGEYISNRVQFGQPIAKFQSARHRAAEMLMHTESSRWAAYYALNQLERDGSANEIWLAKHWTIRAAEPVLENGHMLHGGIGAGTEHPLHLFTKQLAGFVVRAGGINEMTERIAGSLQLEEAAAT